MQAADALVRRARPWLGTIVEIGVSLEHETAIEVGFAEIARIHRLMSFHEGTSDLAKLRIAVPGQVVALDADTVAVLQIAADLHDATGGIFNIAIGRQLIRTRFLPRVDVVHLDLFDGDASDIEIVDALRVRLRRRTLIDLGGIAKGYAVDCAVSVFVLNTYTKFDGYNVKAADDYWAATKDYWSAVRAEWDKVAATKGGFAIKEEAETGTVISGRLLEIADEIQSGKMKQDKAIAEALKLIQANTSKVG